MRNLSDLLLTDVLPSSIAGDEQVRNIAAAVQAKLQSINSQIELILLLPRLDELPEALVDELAWQYHVDFYDYLLPVDKKRALVRQAIDWHRRKGTPGAIIDAVTSVYGNCLLEEWWEYGGEPYHFRVKTTLYAEDDAKRQFLKAREFILQLKNTRSWLDKFMIYYPDIILPVPIKHKITAMGMVDAKQNIWNLADNAEYIYWDGVHILDGSVDWSGMHYYGNYNTMQRHQANIDVWCSSAQIISVRHISDVLTSVAARPLPIKIDYRASVINNGYCVLLGAPHYAAAIRISADTSHSLPIAHNYASGMAANPKEKMDIKHMPSVLLHSSTAGRKAISNCVVATNQLRAVLQGTVVRRGDMSGGFVFDGSYDLSGTYDTNKQCRNLVCCEKINAAGAAMEGSFERL